MLEDDAEVMTNTQLEELLAGQPADVQDEIIRINTDARPLALQVALLIPILAGLIGLFNVVPHDAAARPQTLRLRRRHGPGLTVVRYDATGSRPPYTESAMITTTAMMM